jgi:DDE superfamily endonuclease
MSISQNPFENNVTSILEKDFYFTKHEISILWAIISILVGSKNFSLSAVSRRFGRKIGRNSCAQTLKKFSFVQEKIVKRLLDEIISTGNGKTNWYIIIDDTLVGKIGKTIFRSFKWFDHTKHRQIQAIGLVTLVLVVDKQPVFFMPWILSSPKQNSFYVSTPSQQQGMKAQAAQTMILFIIDHLIANGVTRKHIFVEADSWYGTKKMRKFLNDLEVNYRLDGKKSYSVQIPNFEAINQPQMVRRGRKRKQFVKYVKISQYFGPRETWKSFLDLDSGHRIYFKIEQLNLKKGGQSLVYAFWDEKYQNPKFILTDVKRLRRPSPKTIYYQYHLR